MLRASIARDTHVHQSSEADGQEEEAAGSGRRQERQKAVSNAREQSYRPADAGRSPSGFETAYKHGLAVRRGVQRVVYGAGTKRPGTIESE